MMVVHKNKIGSILNIIRDEYNYSYDELGALLEARCASSNIETLGKKQPAVTRIWDWCKGGRDVPERYHGVVIDWGIEIAESKENPASNIKLKSIIREIVLRNMLSSITLSRSQIKKLNMSTNSIVKLVNDNFKIS